MPRTARATEANMAYHVRNRGNGPMRLFHKPGDDAAFEKVLVWVHAVRSRSATHQGQ